MVVAVVVVMVLAVKSGVSAEGLTTPVEKSETGELSHVAGEFQLPEAMLRK